MSMLFDPRPFNGGKGVLIVRCEQCGGEVFHVSSGPVYGNGWGTPSCDAPAHWPQG